MERTWCTIEDVQEDLAQATGATAAAAGAALDERCLVYGDCAPRPLRLQHSADADAEMALQLGCEAAALQASATHRPLSPDLVGITKMLRMVENYGTSETSPPPSTNEVIVISKLNPSAEEFLPNHAPLDPGTSILLNNNNSITSEKIDKGSDEYQTEREELAALLKHKIRSQPLVDDSFRSRQEKYVAIVNLLKLHSTPPPAAPAAAAAPAAEPVQLRTPDYFKSRIANTIDNDDRINESDEICSASPSRPPAADPEGQGEVSAGAAADAAEVQASIFKVSNWFESKPCVPAPPPAQAQALPLAPHLGPVGFKRKQRSPSGAAPAERKVSEQSAPQMVVGAGLYVPSAGAAALRLQYEGRAREAERRPPPGMWDALQEALRRKDKEVRDAAASRPTENAPPIRNSDVS